MSRANKVLIVLILVIIILFAGYRVYEEVSYRKLLKTYSTAYTEIIKDTSGNYGIDPYIVTAVMHCESNNQANAVSPRGAVGLMQIMPDTGKWIAHKLDMDSDYSDEMLYVPETNIEFGCWYLRFLFQRFGDKSLVNILAAYNAGHGNVEKWLANSEYATDGELTSIPYAETDRYVSRVLNAYQKYKELYPELYQ